MIMKYSVYCLIIVCIAVLTSCNDDPSLEKYIIKNQDDSAFMTLDVPAGLFIQEKNMDGMPEDVQRAIKSVKKANVIALPLDDGNKKRMEEEMAEMDEILRQEKKNWNSAIQSEIERLVRFKKNIPDQMRELNPDDSIS
jgi:predicted small secreted protein